MGKDDGFMFSFLPKDESEALLLQAFQHLDWHHLFGIVPRVCRSWYRLSYSVHVTSQELVLRNKAFAQQSATCLRHYASTLQHLIVDAMQLPSNYALLAEVLDSIHCCKSLSSLHFSCWKGPLSLSEHFLTKVTSLGVRYHAGVPFDFNQLSKMGQLKTLDLRGTRTSAFIREAEVHQLLSALPNLTSLDLTHTGIRLEHLASCPNLPPLQELKLSTKRNLEQKGTLEDLAVLPCTSLHVPYGGYYSKSHAELSRLAKAAGQLRHLTLTGGTVGVKDLASLSGLTQLTSLHFTYHSDFYNSTDVVPPLAALPNLQQLAVAGLSDCQADAVRAAAAAGQLPRLKELKVVASLALLRD
jgi:Leucine-rich repeat (LRR) protein